MQIDKNLIEYVAKNAKLNLTEKEVDTFLPQLKEIFEAFSKINQIDTDNTLMSLQPIPIKNALREDIIEPSLTQEEALRNTSHKKDGYFKGPRAV